MVPTAISESRAAEESRPGSSHHQEIAIPSAPAAGSAVPSKNVDDDNDAYEEMVKRLSTNQSHLRNETGVHVRPSGQQMADFIHVGVAKTALKAGALVTTDNIKVDMMVVRGPAWNYGDDDGGVNQPGKVVTWDRQTKMATVHWMMTGLKFDCRIGSDSDLREGHAASGALFGSTKMSNAVTHIKRIMGSRVRVSGPETFQLSVPVKRWPGVHSFSVAPSKPRRSSQHEFDQAHQTCIIFDWDDTLFPRTYLRNDLGFCLRTHIDRQEQAPAAMRLVAKKTLARSARSTERLLRYAAQLGHVILVTLAREPWVTDSCRNFFPGIGELIETLGVEVVYAQKGKQVDYDLIAKMQADKVNQLWSNMKGAAIAKALESFYSQYEGQTWKNVISIGDSSFERRGTIGATLNYANSLGLTGPPSLPTSPVGRARAGILRKLSREKFPSESSSSTTLTGSVGNHEYKIRTKTIKLLNEPSVEEMVLQLGLLEKWMSDIVSLDAGCDVDLKDFKDATQLAKIEAQLKGSKDV